MAGLIAELAKRGHRAVLATQQIGSAPEGVEVWQAPLWPRQLTTLARRAAVSPATMGDILVGVGLTEPGALSSVIGAWDRLLGVVAPDCVVADFAPGLMLAAFGRFPLLSVGTGFALPPPHLPRFPSLTGQPTVHEEAILLDLVNAALVRHGRPDRETLPGIFKADRELAAVFTELDPYRPWRQSPNGVPDARLSAQVASGQGEELFVYLNGNHPRPTILWQGLVESGLRVRIYDPILSSEDRRALSHAGLIMESMPVPFDRIVERSRLVLSHGGLGLVCSALLAGLPQLLLPHDVEKRMTAANVEQLGLGSRVAIDKLDAGSFAASLRATFENAALGSAARTAASGFRQRMGHSAAEEAADAVAGLLR